MSAVERLDGQLVVRMLLVTLALLFPSNGGSLGIGIDVLPEAFGFAARRVGFAADLRLTACTASRCLWDLGDGVQIAADRSKENLDIYRLEATLDRASAHAAASSRRYEQACLAIIALVDRGARLADLRIAAKAIFSSPDTPHAIPMDNSDRKIYLYSDTAARLNHTSSIAKRCGAAAS